MAKDLNCRAGEIWVTVNGSLIEAKGSFTIQPGVPKRDMIIGADRPHGYKTTPQAAYIEGAITDHMNLDTVDFRKITNATVTVALANDKTWILEDAWYAGEGTMTTDEGEIGFRFESCYPAKEIM
jgi:hypothetical protein